jgi:mRNA-degrading endonuclease toxin of MazEF toxin-antitoxin module
VFIEDWRSAGLVKPSIVKTTKIFTMQKNLVLKSLGHLHPETMREVISNIKTVLDDQPR